MSRYKDQSLWTDAQAPSLAEAPYNKYAALKKIVPLRRSAFRYDNSVADERYFRIRLSHFAMGRGVKGSLIDECFEMIYQRNNPDAEGRAYTSRYLHFSENSQRLRVEDKFYEYAKLMLEVMNYELRIIEKYYDRT